MRHLGLVAAGAVTNQHTAAPEPPALSEERQLWLLAATLAARAGGVAADLDQMPELFGAQITVGLDAIRRSPHFDVQRQGTSWDLVTAINPPVVLRPGAHTFLRSR
jgi:hypothetical protein